jgi:hypothetical protein
MLPTEMSDRIRSLIYLDAFVPENGKSLFDYMPDGGKGMRQLAVAHGDGWKMPPIPAAHFACRASHRARMEAPPATGRARPVAIRLGSGRRRFNAREAST